MARPPPTPTNVQASDGTYTNGVLVTWQFSGGGIYNSADRWDIYRWADGEAPRYYTSHWGDAPYLDTMDVYGIPSDINTNYNYAVRAYSYYRGSSELSAADVGYVYVAGSSISGTTRSDTLLGTNGADIISGLSGNDTLYGGNHNDTLYGGTGKDRLNGDAGNDTFVGNKGNDTIYGGDGNDELYGGKGKDVMSGGSGADTFAFRNKSESKAKAKKADNIQDFQQGSDVIDLSAIDAFNFIGTTAFGRDSEGEIRYKQFDKAGTKKDFTMVYIDIDSDRGAEMSIKLKGLYTLTEDDFIL